MDNNVANIVMLCIYYLCTEGLVSMVSLSSVKCNRFPAYISKLVPYETIETEV